MSWHQSDARLTLEVMLTKHWRLYSSSFTNLLFFFTYWCRRFFCVFFFTNNIYITRLVNFNYCKIEGLEMAFPTNNVRYQQVWNFLLFGILSSIDLGDLSFDMWMQFSNQIIHLKKFCFDRNHVLKCIVNHWKNAVDITVENVPKICNTCTKKCCMWKCAASWCIWCIFHMHLNVDLISYRFLQLLGCIIHLLSV